MARDPFRLCSLSDLSIKLFSCGVFIVAHFQFHDNEIPYVNSACRATPDLWHNPGFCASDLPIRFRVKMQEYRVLGWSCDWFLIIQSSNTGNARCARRGPESAIVAKLEKGRLIDLFILGSSSPPIGLLCRSFGAVAEVRLTAFGNSHFTSSRCSDQQPPPLDGLAPI
jgi:hypothetical protein